MLIKTYISNLLIKKKYHYRKVFNLLLAISLSPPPQEVSLFEVVGCLGCMKTYFYTDEHIWCQNESRSTLVKAA
jgi:hypothetical protein